MERLKNTGNIPINRDILFSLYNDPKHSSVKVSELERKGLVIRVKRDLYMVSQMVHGKQILCELVFRQSSIGIRKL